MPQVGNPKWVKGVSGNPEGLTKRIVNIESLCRFQAPNAVKALTRIMTSAKSPASAVVSAACAILDRGYGKPRQDVHLTQGDEFSELSDDALRERVLELARAMAALDRRGGEVIDGVAVEQHLLDVDATTKISGTTNTDQS